MLYWCKSVDALVDPGYRGWYLCYLTAVLWPTSVSTNMWIKEISHKINHGRNFSHLFTFFYFIFKIFRNEINIQCWQPCSGLLGVCYDEIISVAGWSTQFVMKKSFLPPGGPLSLLWRNNFCHQVAHSVCYEEIISATRWPTQFVMKKSFLPPGGPLSLLQRGPFCHIEYVQWDMWDSSC